MKPNDPSDLDPQDMDFTDDDLLDSDLESFDDDGEIYDDENWDDTAQDQPAAPAKKKSSAFTYGVIGVAALIGVGILYSQFSGGESAAPAQSEIAAPAPQIPGEVPAVDPNSLAGIQDAPPVINAVPPAPDQPSTTEGGFMNDPTVLDQSGIAPVPSLPEAPSMTTPEIEAAELPVPQNLPNIEQIKKAAPPAEAAPQAPAPEIVAAPLPATAPVPTPVAQNTATPDPSVANPAIDVMMAKLDQISERLTALESKPAATSPAAPASENSAEVAKLSEALTRLEKKVDQMAANPAPSRSASTYSEETPVKVNPRPAPKPKAKKPVPKKTSTSSAGKWELRAAWPGEAMVAKPGEAELKTVRIGDSVVGIGQIQSITQTDGRWVVQGTSGSIRQ